MKNIPPDLENSYKTLLDQESVSRQSRTEYQKWFRYYLDFCQKYSFDQSNQDSLAHFIDKLRKKNQTAQQQSQATQAIQLYYKLNAEKEPIKQDTDKQKEQLKTTKDWSSVYSTLSAEINLRHYSPKTLRAYQGWVRPCINLND